MQSTKTPRNCGQCANRPTNGKFGDTHHNEGNSQGQLNIGEAWFLLNIMHNVDVVDWVDVSNCSYDTVQSDSTI